MERCKICNKKVHPKMLINHNKSRYHIVKMKGYGKTDESKFEDESDYTLIFPFEQ